MPSPYEVLYNELAFALLAGKPETVVMTPGSRFENTAEQVVADDFAGNSGSLAALLRIVAQVAAGKPAQEAARTWIDGMASRHAEFRCDDLADEPDDGADARHDERREQALVGAAA